ncbi:MAG: MdtA/MuxA family multidrug efflux RND transporter periplasmic adaptor subunit [Lautropia sp.]
MKVIADQPEAPDTATRERPGRAAAVLDGMPPSDAPEPDVDRDHPRSRGGARLWWLLVVLALLGVAGWYGWQAWQARTAAPTAPPLQGQVGPAGGSAPAAGRVPGAAGAPTGPGGFGGPGGIPATPVVGEAARAGDVPIFLDALGTVTPAQSVIVRSRVAGQLERVLFKEGDMVTEGQVLAEIDPRQLRVQLAQVEGQLARDRALLENARVDLKRYETLYKQDSIARQQVDTQAALVRQYEGLIRVDQGQVENARLQLSYARVTAPISGRVGLRQVDAGNMVTGSEANGLVVITQVQPITALFSVPQDELPTIRRRLASGETLPVIASDRAQKNRLATGTLVTVDNQIDPATGTVKLKAQFDNTDGQLFPNQFVNIRLELDTLRDVVTIPSSAIQRGSQGLFVYVVRPDQTVSLRIVELGPVDGQRIAISKGLAAGEIVVIDGVDRLRDGARVELTQRPDFSQPVAPRQRQPGARGPGGPGGPRGPGAGQGQRAPGGAGGGTGRAASAGEPGGGAPAAGAAAGGATTPQPAR